MAKYVLVGLIISVAIFTAIKLTAISTSSSVQALSSTRAPGAKPAIDPNTFMHQAPRHLPAENWNPI
jgi:hypothetical protein